MPNPKILSVAAVVVSGSLLAMSCTDSDDTSAPEATVAGESAAATCLDSTDSLTDPEATQIVETAQAVMDELNLQAVVVRVDRGGQEVITAALGETLHGVPATPDMRFWNGAAVFSYLGTVMLQLHDEEVLDIDAPIVEYRPDVPGAEQITPRMLMASTSGYVDYVAQQEWGDELYANPFQPFTQEEFERYVFDEPLRFEPGTNVGYSHLNFRLAGEVIETAAGQPLEEVLTERIIEPLGMDATTVLSTAHIPGPRLHMFSDERGLYEETTGWSPAWGVPEGALMATDVCDLATAARAVGSGELLSDEAFEIFVGPETVALGEPTDDCPSCLPMSEDRYLGFGVVVMGDWVAQTPLFTGISGVQAHLDSEDLSIAVASTFAMGADVDTNGSLAIFTALAAELAPEAALPGM